MGATLLSMRTEFNASPDLSSDRAAWEMRGEGREEREGGEEDSVFSHSPKSPGRRLRRQRGSDNAGGNRRLWVWAAEDGFLCGRAVCTTHTHRPDRDTRTGENDAW